MTEDEWNLLLNNAGLDNLTKQTHLIKTRSEVGEHIKRYGWRHFLGTLFKSPVYALKSAKYREFIKETKSAPKKLPKYIGYGFFVGKKP